MSAPRKGCGRTIVAITALLLAAVAFFFYRIESGPGRVAGQVSRTFAEVAGVQPRITVNERVYFEQTTSVLELAVVSRETRVEREIEHRWLGSKKRLKLCGVYEVRAGFDLTQPFDVKVEAKRIRAKLPAPRILSIDQRDLEILVHENGIWNRIKPTELESELKALPILARQKASEAGLQKEALAMFRTRLRERFAPDYEVDFINPRGPLD